MLTARTFQTANGYCHILLDKIIFTDTQEPIEIEPKESKSSIVHTVIQSILTGLFVCFSIVGFMSGNICRGLFFAVLAIVLAFMVVMHYLYPDAPVIDRAAITKIQFKPFIYGVQKPHFVVYYKDSKVGIRERQINLAGSKYAASEEEIQYAINIMEEEFGY